MRIDQWVPALHRGDAIGDSARLMRDAFRSWGFSRGGTGAISLAIAGAAREAGAEIRVQAAVERIKVSDGRTTGVVTLRSTVHNQRRELVLEGMQKFLIRKRPT